MKNFKLNPSAKNIELKTKVSIQQLETEGFDFEQYHEDTASALSIDIEDARAKNYREYSAVLELIGDANDISTYVSWYSYDRNESSDKEATGDDEQTIKDIINMLNEGTLTIGENEDYTTDSEGRYCPTFIEA